MDHDQQAVTLDPGNGGAHANLGNVYLQLNRLPEAIDQFGQALRINPADVGTHLGLASALLKSGRVPEAVAQYEEVLKINPAATVVRKLLAHLKGHAAPPATK
jgi:cytochrome c-type biogenesis protein CcmH/NrfG